MLACPLPIRHVPPSYLLCWQLPLVRPLVTIYTGQCYRWHGVEILVHGSALLNLPLEGSTHLHSAPSPREGWVEAINNCPNQEITTGNSETSCSQLHSERASPCLRIPGRPMQSALGRLQKDSGCICHASRKLTLSSWHGFVLKWYWVHMKKKFWQETTWDHKIPPSPGVLQLCLRTSFLLPWGNEQCYSILLRSSMYSPAQRDSSHLILKPPPVRATLVMQFSWSERWNGLLQGWLTRSPGLLVAVWCVLGYQGWQTSTSDTLGNNSVSEFFFATCMWPSLKRVLFFTDSAHLELGHRRQGIIS